MSKLAVIFLLLSPTCFIAAMALPLKAGEANNALGAGSAVFAALLILTLIKGRRIKFDPLLR